MRLSVSHTAALAAAAALAMLFAPLAQAQSTAAPTAGNGTYIATDPLANVHYDNRFDLSLGAAYGHIHAGPVALQGANLGGLDLTASYWFSKRWALEGSGRGYLGTSGVASVGGSNAGLNNVRGPFVSQYLFVAGPEWLGPHNKHGAILAHVLVGGVYGDFEKDLLGESPALFDFYNNQIAPAAIAGGHFDLNRSPRWVFRVTPDAVLTHYSINYGPKTAQYDVNFAISVGVQYKFKTKR